MAETLRFPSESPVHQWHIRREIEHLLDKMGWDIARCMKAFADAEAAMWHKLDDYRLSLLHVWLQEEYMLAQCSRKQSPFQAAKAAAPARHARMVAFPAPPEALARLEAKRIAAYMHAAEEFISHVIEVIPATQTTRPLSKAEAADLALRKEAHRQTMLARIPVALKELCAKRKGFTEDVYRFLLQELWDVNSDSQLTNEQLHQLMVQLQRLERGLMDNKPQQGKRNSTGPALVVAPVNETPAHAVQAELDGKRSAEKTRYIQRVKMLQRDCEKALPNFDDDTYRAILHEQFNGATSSKDLNPIQLRVLLMYMKGLLLNATGGAAKCSFDAPALLYHDPAGLDRERLMRRIGAALKAKGAQEGKYVPWNYALGILKNVSGKVVTEWNDALPVNLKAVIAALHADAKRKGRRTR